MAEKHYGLIREEMTKGGSFDEQLQAQLMKEAAASLGRCGAKIEKAINRQQELLQEIMQLIPVDENFRVKLPTESEAKRRRLTALITAYNASYSEAQQYRYYLDVQLEALKLRPLAADDYVILPRIKVRQ